MVVTINHHHLLACGEIGEWPGSARPIPFKQIDLCVAVCAVVGLTCQSIPSPNLTPESSKGGLVGCNLCNLASDPPPWEPFQARS